MFIPGIQLIFHQVISEMTKELGLGKNQMRIGQHEEKVVKQWWAHEVCGDCVTMDKLQLITLGSIWLGLMVFFRQRQVLTAQRNLKIFAVDTKDLFFYRLCQCQRKLTDAQCIFFRHYCQEMTLSSLICAFTDMLHYHMLEVFKVSIIFLIQTSTFRTSVIARTGGRQPHSRI